MLGRAAPSGACASLRSIVSISFNALDKLSSFRIYLGEGVNCVGLRSILVPVALYASLDECTVASSPLGSLHVVQVGLTTAIVAIPAALKRRRWLVKASVNCRIHLSIVNAAHLDWSVLRPVIV